MGLEEISAVLGIGVKALGLSLWFYITARLVTLGVLRTIQDFKG